MKALQKHCAKAVKAAPSAQIADGLKRLVMARLKRSAFIQSFAEPKLPAHTAQQRAAARAALASMAKPSRRRSPRGRIRFYTPTDKVDVSRLGTFRHYMISTIRAHTNTRDAERTHFNCDNPKFASNRLDFNWAANEGFINWD